MVDYYKEFELDPEMSNEEIRKKLFKEKKVWSRRQNSADLERRQEAERKVMQLSICETIFSKPDERKKYDEALKQQRQREAEQQQAQQEAQERARQEAQERARQEAQERARQEAQERTRQEAQQRTQQETQEQARQQNANQQQYYNQYQNQNTYNTQTQSNSGRSSYGTPARSGLSTTATGIITYFSWIGWLIAYFVGDREGAKVHINQSLILILCQVICYLASCLGGFLAYIFLIAQLGLAVFWIIGFIYACKGEQKEIPILGSIHILK